MGTTSHVLKDYHQSLTVKPIKIWQFTTSFPFLGNGSIVERSSQIKSFLGINEKIWAIYIIQRYIIPVEIVRIKSTRF